MTDDLQQRLQAIFRTEAAEHIQTMNKALLKLERATDEPVVRENLQNAFRAAHSLKGAARSVSMDTVGRMAHAVENVLDQMRDGRLELDVTDFDTLYQVLDTFESLLDGKAVDVDSLCAVLDGLHAPEPEPEPEPRPEPEARPEPGKFIPAGSSYAEETIRVSVSKLDDLMAQMGELLVTRISAQDRVSEIDSARRQLAEWPAKWREIKVLLAQFNGHEVAHQIGEILQSHALGQQALGQTVEDLYNHATVDALRLDMLTDGLQDNIRRVRMVAFDTLTLNLERVVRDAARTEGKTVVFSIEGSEVELDRKVLEILKDPLVHLLRNAIGHGIESPPERRAAGKPEAGTVTIQVDQHGNEAVIAVSDDGRGFNLDGLRDYDPDAASDDEVIGLAFQPGVTTAQAVTDISGRGVGLDVVREQIETIHGRIGVVNRPGQGVTIELTVPTSLAMTQGLMVRVGQSVYALPLLAVEKILWPEEVFAVNDRWMLPVDNTSIPLVSLADLLDEPETNSDRRQQAVIVAIAQYRVALLVDRVLAQQELAVKPLGDLLVHIPMVQGAALLGDGKPVIVLNPADLVKGETRTARLRVTEAVEDLSGTHILVVDDSITTRTLEQNILEMAGYQVMTAVNGQEALDKLAETAFDCIISDIEMPLVDGFELTRRIRADARFSDLPVILVTSLAKADDRERGLHAGADAYIVKRGFDQGELLRIIKDLLV